MRSVLWRRNSAAGSAGRPVLDEEIVYSSWRHEVVKFDGDLVMLTDNPVLLRRYKKLPTLMCAQRKADKIVPTDEDFIKANIASFGNEVGAVTNRVTSMYEVRSHFDRNSDEYKELNYRIRSGQQLQQDVIND